MTSPGSFHALRFGRAAGGYEAQAGVQARMADALLSLWGARPEPAHILEFGCGTGLLTRRLAARFPGATLLATDAAPEMLDAARTALSGMPRVTLAVRDARGDTPPEPRPQGVPPDLLASGALVQWFPDLAAHLRYAVAQTAPGASYLVSGFDSANFPELNALLAEPPFSYRRFPGHAPGAVEGAAQSTGWSVAGFLSWEEIEVLPSARAVLRRMQDLGSVRDPREGGRMNRANLAHLLAEYERRYTNTEGNVPLTWKPWVALLVR